MKHFCAYICWRLDSQEGIDYNPTNTNCDVKDISQNYKDWFVNKVGLPVTTFQLMEKSGQAKHWRTYVKESLAEENTQKVIKDLVMFPDWLAEVDDRKKVKVDANE